MSVVSAWTSVASPSPDTGCAVETGCEVEIPVDSAPIPSVSQSPDTGYVVEAVSETEKPIASAPILVVSHSPDAGCAVGTGWKNEMAVASDPASASLESPGNSINRQLSNYIIDRNKQQYFSERFNFLRRGNTVMETLKAKSSPCKHKALDTRGVTYSKWQRILSEKSVDALKSSVSGNEALKIVAGNLPNETERGVSKMQKLNRRTVHNAHKTGFSSERNSK